MRARLLSVSALALGMAVAQEAPAPAPAPAPGGGGGGTTGPSGPTQGPGQQPGGFPGQQPGQQQPGRFPQDPTQQRSPFPQEMERPIFFSGKVMMEDGTPPPEPVTIERVCNGVARAEGYTDSKGRFSFQLGQNQGVFQDASVNSADPSFGGGGGGFGNNRMGTSMGGRGVSERDLMGCELRAALPGFRSDIVNLAGRRAFDNPDVGTIVLRRLANVEGTTISMTTLQAPKDAKKAYEKAKQHLAKRKFADARKELDKAVQIYPKYAIAWFDIGRLQQNDKDIEGARASYAKALEADAKYVSPYLQMALLSAGEGKWKDVADTSDRVLKLNPVEFPEAFFYNAVANYNLKNFDAAERSAREAVKLDSQHRMPKASHLLGLILADKRDYTGAAEHMRAYLKFAPKAQDAETVRGQLAELEKLTANEAKAAQ